MVAVAGRVFERGGDVAVFEQRIILKDFFTRRPRRQEVQDVFDPDAQPAKAGPPAALAGIDCYPSLIACLRNATNLCIETTDPIAILPIAEHQSWPHHSTAPDGLSYRLGHTFTLIYRHPAVTAGTIADRVVIAVAVDLEVLIVAPWAFVCLKD